MKYRVLKSRLILAGNDGEDFYRVSWVCVGFANSIAHAKELGFICPVLEEVK